MAPAAPAPLIDRPRVFDGVVEHTGLELRQGTPADADAITELVRQAYVKWVPLIGREPRPMQVDYVHALTDRRFDVLTDGQDLAAVVETERNGPVLVIINIAVRPSYQGSGLARALMTHVEALAATEGCSSVTLYTNARFEANIGLYRSLGYQPDYDEAIPDGVLVHMSKPLPASSS